MIRPDDPSAAGPIPKFLPHWREAISLGALAVLAVFFLGASWRKWPDPLVDFGRELYLPWRLTQGAVLYRDIDHVYGPFSPYFNCFVFLVGGVGMTSLIVANLIIYAAILGLLYYLVCEAWGRGVAFVSGAIFVGVFSFSHLVGIGNYNFVTPYSHEATHGFLVGLLLILTWRCCLERFARWKVMLAGWWAGLTVLLKPEAMIMAGAVTFGAVWLLYRRNRRELMTKERSRKVLWFLSGCLLPVIGATVLFGVGAGFSWEQALGNANYAWISVWEHLNIKNEPLQKAIIGTDCLGMNLIREVIEGVMVLAFGFGLALACRQYHRAGHTVKCGLVFITGAALVGCVMKVSWLEIATALPGLLIFAAVVEVRRISRAGPALVTDRAAVVRVFLWLAAVSLLARMAFDPRIEHYGFFQAPLAAIVGVATLLNAVPEYLRIEGVARKTYQLLIGLLILVGGGVIAGQSLRFYAMQTQPVGKDRDLFMAFRPRIEPTGIIVEALRDYFSTKDPGARSLMVIPDGVMLNYLTRLPSTVPQYMFFPSLLEDGREQDTLEKLKASPPDRVVLISRDLREVGAERFGDVVGHGKLLLDFVEQNYDRVAAIGGDPLDVNQHGAWILALKPKESQRRNSANLPAPH